MESFDLKVKNLLEQAVGMYGSAKALAAASGVSAPNISRWRQTQRSPRVAEIAPILDLIGAEISLKSEKVPSKEINIAGAAASPAEARFPAPRPHADDYLAVPLVSDFAAGPGHIPPENVKDWLIVSRNHMAVRVRKNILGVQLSRDALNMEPTLRPGNIVLVDRDDRNVENGRMFLVREPDDNGDASIKRVAVTEAGGKEQDFRITYYGDNPAYPPRIYSLQKDFGGDWENVVVGRVLCVWADMRER